MKFDVLIPCAGKDIQFVPRVVKYITMFLTDADNIYIVTNNKYCEALTNHLKRQNIRCLVLDENQLLEGLTFANLNRLLKQKREGLSTGWYFQQFLKYGFALTDKAKKYYLTWDADTLPLKQINFFEEEHPLFTKKYEYNINYFKTIRSLLGLKKENDFSFIAEHMMFNTVMVKELLQKIESSNIKGNNWIEKIINAGDYDDGKPAFSEFETYGTFVTSKYPNLYHTRLLNTFRCGGYIKGRYISDTKLKSISFDCDTISFELCHMPPFPTNLLCWIKHFWFAIVNLKQYSLIGKFLNIIFSLKRGYMHQLKKSLFQLMSQV